MLVAFHSRGQKAGKNTCGGFACDWAIEQGWSAHQTAFGNKMKLLCAHALGHSSALENDEAAAVAFMDRFKFDGELGWSLPDGWRASDKPPDHWISGRDFIINLAEGARALFGPNFWIDQLLEQDALNWERREHVTAITDLRFDVEAQCVHAHDGVVVEIVNPRAENIGKRSEQGIGFNLIDYQIQAGVDDLEILRSRTYEVMESIRANF